MEVVVKRLAGGGQYIWIIHSIILFGGTDVTVVANLERHKYERGFQRS